MTSSELHTVYRKSNEIVARKIEGELIIIPLVAGIGNMENELYALEEVGQDIWNRIDGSRSVKQIIDELETTYDAPRETIEADVLGLIGEMAGRKLITADHEQ